MLKLTPVLMGFVAAATTCQGSAYAIAQPSVATNAVNHSLSTASAQPANNLHAQLIIKIGSSPERYEHSRSSNWERKRYLERARWEAKRRRYSDRYYGRDDDRYYGRGDEHYERYERYERR